MTSNLVLNNNANISVLNTGAMYFSGNNNQNSAGGIVEGANSTGQIFDEGVVRGTADQRGQVLTVQPQVFIAVNGQWTEMQNERMKFTFTDGNNDPSVTVYGLGGALNLGNNSIIQVADPLLLSGGSLILSSIPGVNSTATVQGNINDYQNGNLQVGDANGFAQLTVTGNVDIEQTGTLTMWVSFNAGQITNDSLAVSGQFAIDNAGTPNTTLNVTTMGNPRMKGLQVTLVTAGSTATKSVAPFVFDTTQWNGTYPYAAGTLGAQNYVLTT